ncbi:hypothetical protein SAMN05443572_106387 [Myxococcus fulvus]|uniref:Carbohydrate-binding domain-containing protein n=1 Tax=Myxococcus fulvus TaxID=33 RepID=A0A511T4C9_MYXFU|nr:hypothetical protein [Myxococcus fulvus]GEN08188.1 hypothetical protein MFU01_32250 [Myxococcus fulvus]SEU22287.1 hypothetical protein SAMN05443572_106387 [Myxococcus fulvus]
MKRVLLLWLCFGSTTALAAPTEPWFEKGSVLVETPEGGAYYGLDTQRRIGCEGRLCLWHVVQSLGPCFYGLCTNQQMVLSDLEGRFLGAAYDLDAWASNSLRFIDAEHVEVVTQGRNEPFNIPADGMDPTQVSWQVLKVAPDGSRFTQAPSPMPKWTKPAARRGKVQVVSKPPKSLPVDDALLARARALCRKDLRFIPVDYACRDGACLLLLSGVEPSPEVDTEDASPPAPDALKGPFCGLLVRGDELQSLGFDEEGIEVEVSSTAYALSGPVGARGSMEHMETLSRSRPGYMVFSDTVGAVVDGIRPYPVRSAHSKVAALALAPTVQAYTSAHVTWGGAGWKDADDLAFAWRLARVGEALAIHVEVHDDKVVPLGTGTGVHSDHVELTVQRSSASALKLGVLLAAGGKVEARDWTGEANTPLPSIQGTWRRRPQGYEMTLSLPLAGLGVTEPRSSLGFSLAVSDADARGKQETLMTHSGSLMFWTEYPPSIDEYRRHGSMD